MLASVVALAVSGIFIAISILYVLWLMFTGTKLDTFQYLMVGIMLSMAVGIHGVLHFLEEAGDQLESCAPCRSSMLRLSPGFLTRLRF